MPQAELNRFTQALGEVCKGHILDEKWLFAPSRRTGFQWLERVTRAGISVVNVRVATLRGLALGFASQEMGCKGFSYIGALQSEVILERIFAELKSTRGGYLTGLEQTPGLIQSLYRTISDIRLAGVTSEKLNPEEFEVHEKGVEIKEVLGRYEKWLFRESLIDYAAVLELAIGRIKRNPVVLNHDALFIMPDDMACELKGRERYFWESIPEENRLILKTDHPGERPDGELTDLSLLRWILDPVEADAPRGDRTAQMFRAVGEVNEVREVLRRCLEGSIPFEEVEILHTDYATYVPLLYELAHLISADEDDTIPVTFGEGIPVRYSRPARALLGLVSWVREDYPQFVLVRMIQDGLLKISLPHGYEISFARLAAVLKGIPVGNRRDRYLKTIDGSIAGLEKRIRGKSMGEGEGLETFERERKKKSLVERLQALKALRGLAHDLLNYTRPGQSQKELLESFDTFLEKYTRPANQFDAYSLHALKKSIREMAACLEDGGVTSLDILEWLSGLPSDLRVGGLGPRPGKIFVSSIHSGGHSGRRHTFIVGMDDSRFPGTGIQDPLVLDDERGRLSRELFTAGERLTNSLGDFANLLARLRGGVTFSYCCRNLSDDREMFPSPVLLSAYHILSGDREGTLEEFTTWVSSPASFAPNAPERCIDMTEWWLWRMCTEEEVKNPERLITARFPHLGRGFKAREARESIAFTEYDGYVPEAGESCDPAKPGGPVMSASRLETLATCPMEYFFKYILEIEPPEEYGLDPNIWLDPMEKGGLLHEVFRIFMTELAENGKVPEFDRDIGLLEDMLESRIKAASATKPPPSPLVFERERKDLRTIARIFLKGEEEHCRSSRPCYFEAALGMKQDGESTPLDTPKPVEIKLPGRKSILGRGQIDRVDEALGSENKHFDIWDYKTGSAWKYKQDPPFWQGRCVQNVFYLSLAHGSLQKIHPGSSIRRFGYFFPGLKEQGERINWTAEELDKGPDILANLCEMVSKGCFPFTDRAEDVRYSDYLTAFVDPNAAEENMRRKLTNPDNKALASFMELRGYEE